MITAMGAATLLLSVQTPDFEDPTDTGSNNEYQVTVAASDRGFKTTQSVVVRVTNIEEAWGDRADAKGSGDTDCREVGNGGVE